MFSFLQTLLAAPPDPPSGDPKVLFLTRKYPPMIGGLETHSYFLTTGYPGPKTIVALGRLQRHLVWFVPYVSLRVLFGAGRYDVVLLNDPMLAVAGWLARTVWKRKVVVCLHGLDLLYPSRLYQWYMKKFLCADGFVANSRTTRGIAEQRGLDPVVVITIGVSRAFFDIRRNADADPEVAAARRGRPVLLTAGRLRPRKGAAWFVTNVLPRLDVLYVVAGGGRDHAKIKQAAADAGVSDRLLVIWEPEDRRLHALFSAADLFVMPNISIPNDVEGFGIVSIEAAAAGLPVVASAIDGIPDAVADGESGILVEAGNPDAYVTTIQRLLADPDARVRFGEAARDFVRRRNDWSEVVAAYTQLFKRLCGGEPAPARTREGSAARQPPS